MTQPPGKIVVVGGSGRIGSRVVRALRSGGHPVVIASPSFGVDAATGQGLAEALLSAEVLIDVSNPPSLDGEAAMAYFTTAGLNLGAAARAARVKHHIALSIVGTDGLQAGGYFRAKKLQEDLIRANGVPFTLLRSTQFFEFIAAVVQDGTTRDVNLSPALVQPVSAEDVAKVLASLAHGPALDRMVKLAGPHVFPLDDIAREVLTAYEDPRRVITHASTPYFGATLMERSLLPSAEARIGTTGFEDWLRESLQPTLRSTSPHKETFS